MSLLQWHSILNTSSSLPPIHIYDGTKCLHGWNYELWPESAISRECWGMACKAWPESTISHERRGMAQLHRTGVEYKAPEWVVKSQGLEWWILHICVDFIQFSTSFSASAAASASATSAAYAASAAPARTVRTIQTVQTVRRQSSWED